MKMSKYYYRFILLDTGGPTVLSAYMSVGVGICVGIIVGGCKD